MSSRKVSQDVSSITTKPIPAAERALRSRTQSANKGSSIIGKAEGQATSSRAAVVSHRTQRAMALNRENSPEPTQAEGGSHECLIDCISPTASRSGPENGIAMPQVISKVTKASKSSRKTPTGRITGHTRVPWKPEEVDELRRLMDGVNGYPSVENRKKWAAALKKHQNSLDTKVKAEWGRRELREFTVPLNDIVSITSNPPSRHRSVLTRRSSRSSATGFTAGTSAAASSVASTVNDTRARIGGLPNGGPSKVSSRTFLYARVPISRSFPESNIRGTGRD